MALSKYFRFPFGLTGDRAAIPDAVQPSGEVSFEEGYSIDYQLNPATEPSAKNIERDKANQLYYDITQSIKEYQEFGAPYWIEAAQNGGVAFPYKKYALVRYDIGGGETPIFQSLVASNTDLPTVTASWQRLASANPFIVDNATFEASVSNGEVVYWDNANNRYDEALADGTATQNAIGIADVTNSRVFLFGSIPSGILTGLSANVPYYLSTVTPGAITSVRPSSNAVQVGIGKSATTFIVNIIAAQPTATDVVAGLVSLGVSANFPSSSDTEAATPLYVRNSYISKLQPFSSALASNTLVNTLSPAVFDFRPTSLNSGSYNTVNTSSLTLTVPTAASLGLVTLVQGRLVLLVAYNSGAPVLCIANLSGGLQLDETNLISPTTISAGATSSNVIYSASAVSANSPYRIVGFVDVIWTSGTGFTTLTRFQGTGGQALAAMGSLGYGQTWQNLTGSRVLSATYTNTTGKSIEVYIQVNSTIGSAYGIVYSLNGENFHNTLNGGSTAGYSFIISFIVPPGATYGNVGGSVSLIKWMEFR